MKWFDDRAHETGGSALRRAEARYRKHLSGIRASLPAEAQRLATDPSLELRGGRFRKLTVDTSARRVELIVSSGDLRLGYRDVQLAFAAARIIPDDLRTTADAVTAQFGSTHWHPSGAVTEIRDSEIDRQSERRWILRLRLHPFHEFAIVFGQLSLVAVDVAERPTGPGVFHLVTTERRD